MPKDSVPPTDPQEFADFAKRTSLDNYITRAKDWARKELAAAGLPTELLQPVPLPGGGSANLLGLVKDKPQSPEWFAARILRFAEMTKCCIESDNAEGAAWNAVHLAQTICHSDFKMDIEKPLTTGLKVIKGARESGKESRAKRERRDERWRRKGKELQVRHPNWSQRSRIEQIWKDDSKIESGEIWSVSTIRRALQK